MSQTVSFSSKVKQNLFWSTYNLQMVLSIYVCLFL